LGTGPKRRNKQSAIESDMSSGGGRMEMEKRTKKNKGGIYNASLVAMSSLVAIAAIPYTATKRQQARRY
jgi:hypothetical protein